MTEANILDEKQISEIEARANAATAGPWDWACFRDAPDDVIALTSPGGDVLLCTGDSDQSWGEISDEDERFIAHARADVPALCATVRALRAENKRLIQHAADLEHDLNEAIKQCNEDHARD